MTTPDRNPIHDLETVVASLLRAHRPELQSAPGHAPGCPALANPDAQCMADRWASTWTEWQDDIPGTADYCGARERGSLVACPTCVDSDHWPCEWAIHASTLTGIYMDLVDAYTPTTDEETRP